MKIVFKFLDFVGSLIIAGFAISMYLKETPTLNDAIHLLCILVFLNLTNEFKLLAIQKKLDE